jgi:hypothetical protein
MNIRAIPPRVLLTLVPAGGMEPRQREGFAVARATTG